MKNKTIKGNILSIQSHVSYGHAGNSAAIFPMQRLGYNVIGVNTVLFSNHTGYNSWKGDVVSYNTVIDILDGVDNLGVFANIDAIITGYIGNIDLGKVIDDYVDKIRLQNNDVLYVCDPVFGDKDIGIYVSEDIPVFFRDILLHRSDICTPNLFELEWLTNSKINSLDDVLLQSRKLISRGTKIVLVTSVVDFSSYLVNHSISMVAVTADRAWKVTTPRLSVKLPISGSGDVTTALFSVYYVENKDISLALEKTASSMYEIFKSTFEHDSDELEIIASGDRIVSPINKFKSIEI